MNFRTPPAATEFLAGEFEDMTHRYATIYADRLEAALVEALTRHLGRVPSVEEARGHARRMVFPDGRVEWAWDNTIIMVEPSWDERCASGISKSGIVIAKY